MATAMEIAMRRVGLPDAIAQWAKDDKAHVDPPMEPRPTLQQEAAAAQPAPRTEWVTPTSTPTPAPPPAAPEQPQPTLQGEQPMEHAMRDEPDRPAVAAGASAPKTRKAFKLAPAGSCKVSEACFFAVRDNPGALRRDLMEAMQALGYNRSSLSSIFGTLHTRGIIKADKIGHLTTTYRTTRVLSDFYSDRHIGVLKVNQAKKAKRAQRDAANGKRKTRTHAELMEARRRAGRIGGLASGEARRSGKPKLDARAKYLKRKGLTEETVLTPQERALFANQCRWARKHGKPVPKIEDFRRQALAARGRTLPNTPDVRAVPHKKRALDQAHRQATTTIGNSSIRPLDTARGRTDPTPRTLVGKNVSRAQDLLQGLSLVEARTLYELLKTFFKD